MNQPSLTTMPEASQVGLRTTIDLLQLVRRRRRYLSVAMFVGAGLGFCYWLLAERTYESSADVLVVQKSPAAVVPGNAAYESGFEDYLATHLALVVSPMIVERAIQESHLASLPTFAEYLADPEIDLADVIIDFLEVKGGSRELGDSADSIMTLSFRGPVPEDCPVVVQAVLNSYEAFHREIYHGMSDDTVTLVREARDLLGKDLQQQQDEYSQFRQHSPLVSRGTDEINPLQDRLVAIETQRSELLLRRAEVERQLMAIEQARQSGTDFQQLLAIVTDLRNTTTDNGLPNTSTTLETQLVQLMDTEQRLLEHYGPNHPRVAVVRARIAAARRYFALPTPAYMPEPGASDEAGDVATDADPVDLYTRYLQQDLKRIEISEKLLSELYEREHEAAKELSGYQLTDERYQRNIDRTEQLYDVVVSRLQEASLIKDYGGFETRVISPPRLGEKVSPAGRIVLPVGAFAGTCVGFLLALYAEMTDKRFHSRAEIRQMLGTPILGEIPHLQAATDGERQSVEGGELLDPMLSSFFRPRSSATEATRSLRTALDFRSRSQLSRIIQITSPTSQEGTSLLAANLAISLAQAGKRVLLIDANLRHPQQHELFGMGSPTRGLVTVVAMEDEPDDGIYDTSVSNLWLMPAGLLPAGPCELFTSPRFAHLIRLVGERYDYVLLDTGPLLSASDPCVIAARADGLIMNVRLTRDSRQRAQACLGTVGGVGSEAVGRGCERCRRVWFGRLSQRAEFRGKNPFLGLESAWPLGGSGGINCQRDRTHSCGAKR